MTETFPRIRLVLSDMDGTILGSDRTISPTTGTAVQHLAERGVALALVSARIPAAVLPYVRQLGLKGPCAGFNGGVFFMPDGTILKSHHFSVGDLAAILEALSPFPVEVWFQTEQEWLVRDSRTLLAKREQELTGITPRAVSSWPVTPKTVNRLMVCSDDTALIARLEAELAAPFAGRASLLCSAPHKLNITPALATKGEAVAELARLYGVTPQEVAALGDAPNDIPMLQAAGMGIAMGQAPDSVKKEATHVTGKPDEGGWAYAAETFIMPLAPCQQGR
ncbi:Cof-type HAD-IIB family hydrolase [Bombella sp. ESL0387]|nr:Cof-type HAD-IIB family hydrolase [Bombella sp. ESL0387]